MIKLVPIEKEPPHYHVVFNYMIGDADGYTTYDFTCESTEEIEEAIKYISILNKLKPLKDHWGICFDDFYIKDYQENILDYQKTNIIYLNLLYVLIILKMLEKKYLNV
jgi:hypothetical protein